ncbi:RNA helicase [Gracilaria domingensis]|nr:RNA helicase [Gracilaria domingensis]
MCRSPAFLLCTPFLAPSTAPFQPPSKSTPARWTCRRPLHLKRRPKPPAPVSTRPPSNLPTKIGDSHITSFISPAPDCPEAHAVRSTLRSRRDVLVIGPGMKGKILTALAGRERVEHALIMVPTREAAMLAAKEAELRGGFKVIVAAGHGYGSWKHAAMNANSSKRAVIVVATPRAACKQFIQNAHGPPWLKRVQFFMIVDLTRILSTGALGDLRKIIKRLSDKSRRKNILLESRPLEGDLKEMILDMVREKHEIVEWVQQAKSDVQTMTKRELLGQVDYSSVLQKARVGSPRQRLEELVNITGNLFHKTGAYKMIVFFPAARIIECYANLCRERGIKVIDIHSHTSIANRQRGLQVFFETERAVMFASDTLSTCPNLPPIDCVVHMDIPNQKDQYYRRIGLLAQNTDNGKDHMSVVLLGEDEFRTLTKLEGDFALRIDREDIAQVDEKTCHTNALDEKAKRRAYVSRLSFYNSLRRKIGWSREQMVEDANIWATQTFGEIPKLAKKDVNRVRLWKVRGIQTVEVKVNV